jgi:hypothetical protein
MNRSDADQPDPSGSEPELDFERADFGEASPVEARGSMLCSLCQIPISDQYFTVASALVCNRCEQLHRYAGPPGSAASRLMGAIGLGGIAAAAGSALWLAVTELTGYEIGLIAIVVGWIVATAIQRGNRGVGGAPYQVLAVFLTYTAIVMTYLPRLLAEMPPELVSAEAVMVAIPVAYALPFLAGFENAIGILIIGFALFQAWRMTVKREFVWGGPFQVGAGSEG